MRFWTGLFVALMVALATGGAVAQSADGAGRPGFQRRDGGGRMTGEERQRLREDLQRQHANPGGAQRGNEERERRYAEWQRLSPQQREDIRRDMRNANRNLDRRRR